MEEYTLTTKRVITSVIKAQLMLHPFLLIDRLPVHCVALGFGAHVAYLRLVRRFPYMSFTSPEGLTALAGFLASTAAWAYHYWHTYYTLEYTAAFMLITTWIVPFVFFLSAAGDQSVLPGAGGYPYSSPGPAPRDGGSKQKQRRGLALRIFDILRRKRDEVLPDVVSKLPGAQQAGLLPKPFVKI